MRKFEDLKSKKLTQNSFIWEKTFSFKTNSKTIIFWNPWILTRSEKIPSKIIYTHLILLYILKEFDEANNKTYIIYANEIFRDKVNIFCLNIKEFFFVKVNVEKKIGKDERDIIWFFFSHYKNSYGLIIKVLKLFVEFQLCLDLYRCCGLI